jgi:hypothetical protein
MIELNQAPMWLKVGEQNLLLRCLLAVSLLSYPMLARTFKFTEIKKSSLVLITQPVKLSL